jgi:signal peptidase I
MAKKAAAEPAREEGPSWQKSALRENFEAVIFAVLFALFVRTFIAQPYKIPSGSMEDNLLVGDHLVVNKVAFGDGASHDGPAFLPTRLLERGDVVIFRPPPTPHSDENSDYIKRVVGLPGDELTLLHDPVRGGVRLMVNGSPLPESYRIGHFGRIVEEPGSQWTVTFDGPPPEPAMGWLSRTVTLDANEYFVMGDNRNNSADSRFWGGSFAVNGDRIRGLAWFVYWSYDVGDAEPELPTLAARVAHYAKIAVTFFTRTRWERTFLPIR